MLRTGKQPLLPEDLQRVEGMCQNETFQSRLDDVRSKVEVYREVVAEAHKHEKDRQKILYDKDKYDVEFAVGDKVLWLAQNPKDKLFLKWFGPYVVTKKVNDVAYEIEDQIDGEKRVVSVQQIIPFEGEFDASAEAEGRSEAQEKLGDLKYGKFVIFQRVDDSHGDVYHVGQVVEEFDSLTGKVTILHYIDLGVSGTNFKAHARGRAPLGKRILSPEMYDLEGNAYTAGRRKVPLKRQGGAEYQYDYGIEKIAEVVVKNFYLDDKGRIPSDVLLQVKAFEKAKTKRQA